MKKRKSILALSLAMLMSVLPWAGGLNAKTADTGTASSAAAEYTVNSQNIVINEIVFDNKSVEDAVELYNKGQETVDLSGYTLTDDSPDKHLYTFPEQTKLEPGKFLVLNGKAKDPAQGFTFGLGKEDSVVLKDPEGKTVDEFSWTENTPSGSYARIPDGVGSWSSQVELTLGSSNKEQQEEVQAPEVIISEVDSQPDDWIELYNPGTSTIDISGYEIRDDDDEHKFILPAGSTIPAQGFFVIDADTEGKYYKKKKATFIEGKFGEAFGLGDKDQVRIFDPAGTLLDEVSWEKHAEINGDNGLATYSRVPLSKKGELVTSYDTKGKANKPYYGVFINEVESNGDATDWVEIVNISPNPVDISGWYILDNDPLGHKSDTHPLPEGTFLKAGEFFVFDGNKHFDFGLGKKDQASLFDKFGNLVDEFAWSDHAKVTYARIPDGTGAFVDSKVSTKGVSNSEQVSPEPEQRDWPEALAWPGDAEVKVIDNEQMFLEDSSGLDFANGYLWAVDNGTATIWKLALDKDNNYALSFAPGWEKGKRAQFIKDANNPDAPGPDAEGITATPDGLLYLAAERDNAAKKVNYNVILEVNPDEPGDFIVASREWDITKLLPEVNANMGIEAIEWIPNTDLQNLLWDESLNRLYDPRNYPLQIQNGLFFVALEDNGHIYALNLNSDGSASIVADIDSLIGGAMGLNYQESTKLLWVESDDGYANRLATIKFNATTKPEIQHYLAPAGMDTSLNNEGFAIASDDFATGNKVPAFWFADGYKTASLRMAMLDLSKLPGHSSKPAETTSSTSSSSEAPVASSSNSAQTLAPEPSATNKANISKTGENINLSMSVLAVSLIALAFVLAIYRQKQAKNKENVSR